MTKYDRRNLIKICHEKVIKKGLQIAIFFTNSSFGQKNNDS